MQPAATTLKATTHGSALRSDVCSHTLLISISQTLRKLLKQGISSSCADYDKRTACMVAAQEGREVSARGDGAGTRLSRITQDPLPHVHTFHRPTIIYVQIHAIATLSACISHGTLSSSLPCCCYFSRDPAHPLVRQGQRRALRRASLLTSPFPSPLPLPLLPLLLLLHRRSYAFLSPPRPTCRRWTSLGPMPWWAPSSTGTRAAPPSCWQRGQGVWGIPSAWVGLAGKARYEVKGEACEPTHSYTVSVKCI